MKTKRKNFRTLFSHPAQCLKFLVKIQKLLSEGLKVLIRLVSTYFNLVPERRLELLHRLRNRLLRPARLPISPPGQGIKCTVYGELYIIKVPRTRVELVRLPATPSKWCVCQFRHLGKVGKSSFFSQPLKNKY